MNMQTHGTQDDIKQLNAFLQDELAAVETYDQCIKKTGDARISSSLTNLQQSHQARANMLSRRIEEIGGSPERSSGTWGTVANMIEGGAKLFGDKAALSALEEGEDRGRDSYKHKINKLSPENQSFVNTEILPEQQRSHDMLNRVREILH